MIQNCMLNLLTFAYSFHIPQIYNSLRKVHQLLIRLSASISMHTYADVWPGLSWISQRKKNYHSSATANLIARTRTE